MTFATRALASAERLADHAGKVTVTLSREIDTLSDPSPGKGEPVPLQLSGSHLAGVSTITIEPQATWIFRGAVESGTPVAITGDATVYATTARAQVDGKAPETLALPITPVLAADAADEAVVALTEAATVNYPDSRKVGDDKAARRGWAVPSGSAVYVVVHSGLRAPKPGDLATAPLTGTVLNVDGTPYDYSVVQIGGVS